MLYGVRTHANGPLLTDTVLVHESLDEHVRDVAHELCTKESRKASLHLKDVQEYCKDSDRSLARDVLKGTKACLRRATRCSIVWGRLCNTNVLIESMCSAAIAASFRANADVGRVRGFVVTAHKCLMAAA